MSPLIEILGFIPVPLQGQRHDFNLNSYENEMPSPRKFQLNRHNTILYFVKPADNPTHEWDEVIHN